MKLSVIVPVYNERHTIEEIIERVVQVACAKQVIVIDDGSTDYLQAVGSIFLDE